MRMPAENCMRSEGRSPLELRYGRLNDGIVAARMLRSWDWPADIWPNEPRLEQGRASCRTNPTPPSGILAERTRGRRVAFWPNEPEAAEWHFGQTNPRAPGGILAEPTGDAAPAFWPNEPERLAFWQNEPKPNVATPENVAKREKTFGRTNPTVKFSWQALSYKTKI
jgi:hypothetical protein